MSVKTILCASVAFATLCAPAFADDASVEKRLDAMQKMIEAQQQQIQQQSGEIRTLKTAIRKKGVHVETADTAPPPPASVQTKVDNQQIQIDQLTRTFAEAQDQARIEKQDSPSWSLANGRPVIASRDGRFSLAIRALGQFDAAYYMQSGHAAALPAANGPDLSSGANFRRAQLGIQGKLFGDWSYLFNTEFGGSSGTETGGRVQSLYVQYDGLGPLAFRIGAYPPAGGLEDNTASADTLFLERAGPSDIVRNAVGGDGRDAASAIYAGDRFYASLSYTGGKVGDGAVFDEQEAVLGRVADSIWSDADSRLVLSATGADMFRGPDSAAGPNAPRSLTLAVAPELTVDSTGTKLVSTGAVDTDNARFWGAEAGAQWRSLYAQAGYFAYEINQRVAAPPQKPDLNFDGWYAQASWILTGEQRGYSTANAAFTSPRPSVPFSLDGGGWGAWELAGRYSVVDLNDHAGTFALATPFGGIRGGEQKIWTAGVNWYPNAVLRFALDYQWIDIGRLGGTGANVGQNLQALSLRSQISL
ncbi:MAG TPA: porin [Rhizomicrobium sp.]|jgi:phosphate-selective porin OprO/OprP|nr:porin [Rhizomicrobium sp.]